MSGGTNQFDEEIYLLLGQTVNFQADIEHQMNTVKDPENREEGEEEEAGETQNEGLNRN